MLDQMFLIDSERLDEVESRLYGFAITPDGELVFDEVPEQELMGTGYYSLVVRHGGSIDISQDFCGSRGLYVYEQPDRFVISNSFFRLAEYLKGKLSYNKEFARALVFSVYVPCTETETLANEIRKLGAQSSVHIDIASRRMQVKTTVFPFFSKSLFEPATLEQLDRWYERWVRVYRNIVESGRPLYADLSGGFDTRIVFSMLRNANVDMNAMGGVKSHEKVNLKKDADDYRIASAIAADNGVVLNRNAANIVRVGDLDPAVSYARCRYSSFGDTVVNKYGIVEYVDPIFEAKGLGSTVKGSLWRSFGKIEEEYLQVFSRLSPISGGNAFFRRGRSLASKRELRKYIQENLGKMACHYPLEDERVLAVVFERLIAEKYDARKANDFNVNNELTVSPFHDPELAQINYYGEGRAKEDKLFLVTLILDRYAPDLLEYEIQGREIDSQILRAARDLNRKCPPLVAFPGTRFSRDLLPGRRLATSAKELGAYLESIWSSSDFSEAMKRYVGFDLYRSIVEQTNRDNINARPAPINALLAIFEFSKLLS